MKIQHWLLLLSLGISACVTAGGVTESRLEPPLENANEWQGVNCQKIKVIPRSEYLRHAQCEAAQLPPLDPDRREHFGEQYSPRKYLECKQHVQSGDTACDTYKLRRVENPEYWPYPDVPKPKWPEAPKETVYKPGMTSKEYFEALCQAEAGEFIYRTVENVEGIYQVRPRSRQGGDDAIQDRNVLEDPYGYTEWEADSASTLFVAPPFRNYKFFEAPQMAVDGVTYQHYSGYKSDGRSDLFYQKYGYRQEKQPMRQEAIKAPKARYGFTWRGIARPHDRELGIAGGELIVIDLETNEILGLRRGFIRAGMRPPSPIWWLSGGVCPVLTDRPGRPKDSDFTYWFISKVAKPDSAATTSKGDEK